MALKTSTEDRKRLPGSYLGKEPTEGSCQGGLGPDGKGIQVQQVGRA
jgi:hypothetical protein